jgi:hypothetical protein
LEKEAAMRDKSLIFGLGLSLLLGLLAGPASAASGRQKQTLAEMAELDQKAMTAYRAGKHEEARTSLLDAVVLARENGLQRHDVTAKTYLHLGAVHVGLGEREKGLRYLAMALDLRPKIKLQKPMATRPLRSALNEAKRRKQELLGVPPEEVRPRNEARAAGKNKERDATATAGMTGQEAIYCPAPEGAPPRKELKLRCFAAPKLRAVRVFLHYRRPDEDYTALQMNREPKGWYSAAIPAADVTGSAMEYFVEAEGTGGKISGTHGDEQQPNVIAVRKGPAGSRLSLADIRMGDSALLSADGEESESRGDPDEEALAGDANDADAPDEELRASRDEEDEDVRPRGFRRTPGTLWVGFGMGTGYGAHLTRNLEHHPGRKVSPGFAGGGLLQMMPELGIQYDRKLSLSIQSRHQYIQPSGGADMAVTGKPPRTAHALLAHLFYELWAGKQLQFLGTATLGGGSGFRLKVKEDPSVMLASSDTIAGGPVVLGPGLVLGYAFSDRLMATTEARMLLGLGNFAAVLEGSLGVQYAF